MVGKKSLRKAEIRAGYIFISPWILGFLFFTAGPVVVSFILSFSNYSVVNPPDFCGWENYRNIFTNDPLFRKSLWNTVYITILGVPLGMITALGTALFLNLKVKGMAYYRAIYYLPAIMPIVAASILWRWILSPNFGILNAILAMVKIPGPMWLASEQWAKPAIILMTVWASGSSMIIYLAGLQGIPQEFYEAAEIDGANWWHKFWRVTIPLLTPTIFFTLVMGIIFSMQIFTQAYVMTSGGPVDSTLFYVYYLYNNAFAYFKMGYAAALAWILFIVILVVTLFQLRMARYWVYYEAGEKR